MTAEAFPLQRFLSEKSQAAISEAEREALTDYLQHFAIFDYKVLQCKCGRNLGSLPGATLESVMGLHSFTWGIQNGEGECFNCGWPARGIHRVPVPDRDDPLIFYVPLPYHPDFVAVSA